MDSGFYKPKMTVAERCAAITNNELSAHFHLPLNEASLKLGVGRAAFRALCRDRGITRWPYHVATSKRHSPDQEDADPVKRRRSMSADRMNNAAGTATFSEGPVLPQYLDMATSVYPCAAMPVRDQHPVQAAEQTDSEEEEEAALAVLAMSKGHQLVGSLEHSASTTLPLEGAVMTPPEVPSPAPQDVKPQFAASALWQLPRMRAADVWQQHVLYQPQQLVALQQWFQQQADKARQQQAPLQGAQDLLLALMCQRLQNMQQANQAFTPAGFAAAGSA